MGNNFDKYTAREIRHFDYISQSSTVCKRKENAAAADALSRTGIQFLENVRI